MWTHLTYVVLLCFAFALGGYLEPKEVIHIEQVNDNNCKFIHRMQ